MRNAIHPLHDTKINVPDYIRDFGNDAVKFGERPRCPVCNQRLYVVASSSPDSIGHFAHMKNSGFCPTKSEAATPYAGLHPRNPDQEAARRIKKAFLANWEKHFYKLSYIVKELGENEFIDVILVANKEKIWEYANLEEFQLPYIFATLMDFPPSRSKKDKDGSPKRKCWFRCWFDSSVQRYDDLWIHRPSPLKFWRAWYSPPKGKGKPKAEDLINSYEDDLSADFLTYDIKLQERVVTKISKWLAGNFQAD